MHAWVCECGIEGGILLDGENPVAKDLVSSQPMVCAWNARAARGEGIPRLQCGDGMEQGSTRSTGAVPSVPTLPPAAQLESFPPVFVIGCSNRGRCESGCRRRIGLSSCWEFRCYLHARKEVGRAECRVSQPEDTEHPSFFCMYQPIQATFPTYQSGGDLVDSKRAVQMQLRRSQGRVGQWCAERGWGVPGWGSDDWNGG